MPRKIEVDVYSFEELPEAIKKKVIERERNINVDDTQWDQFILQEWEDIFEQLGFTDVEIQYSGFSSQGDGASFTGGIDLKSYIKRSNLYPSLEPVIDLLEGSVTREGRYVHEHSTAVNIESPSSIELTLGQEQDLISLEKVIQANVVDESIELYRELKATYFDLISDESVSETLISNEYEFEANGRRI